MYVSTTLTTLVVCITLLSACDKPPVAPSPLATPPEQAIKNSSIIAGSDTAVPNAESVFPNITTTQPAQPTGRPTGAMTKEQESRGMPIPGQNNDHSAPKAIERP
jgi:hypothetical protein